VKVFPFDDVNENNNWFWAEVRQNDDELLFLDYYINSLGFNPKIKVKSLVCDCPVCGRANKLYFYLHSKNSYPNPIWKKFCPCDFGKYHFSLIGFVQYCFNQKENKILPPNAALLHTYNAYQIYKLRSESSTKKIYT
jgi:hypothetical protein